MQTHDDGFSYLDHAADLAVRAWGPDPGAAFGAAARALVGAMVNLERVEARVRRQFSLRAGSLELLLVDWLAALVAEKDTSGLVFSRFCVDARMDAGVAWLRASAWGEPLDPLRHEARLEVKGISLLGLRVRVDGARWVAEYVADV
jgi:SHS2 domain-containing protein